MALSGGIVSVTGTVDLGHGITGSFAFSEPQKYGSSIKNVAVLISGSGDNVIVSAVANRRIKVMAFVIQMSASSGQFPDVTFKDAVLSSSLAGPFSFGTREGVSAGVSKPSYLFGTVIGSDLVLNISSTPARVGGFVTYFDDEIS